jgi:hypothetical protein
MQNTHRSRKTAFRGDSDQVYEYSIHHEQGKSDIPNAIAAENPVRLSYFPF